MKRILLAAALFCGIALPPVAASSQSAVIEAPTSPVTIDIYGLLNTTVSSQTNTVDSSTGAHGTQVIVGGQGLCCGSRLGISGAAAFGSGIGGVFQIESGFLINKGTLDQQQQIFGRQAYAGITVQSGHVFDVLSVGRQYSAAFAATATADPYGHGAGIYTAWDSALYGARFDNSIENVLNVGRTKLIAQWSPGGTPGNGGAGTTLGGGLIYQAHPFIVSGTASHSEDALSRGVQIYGLGVRFSTGPLSLYSYAYETKRDAGFAPAPNNSGEALANTSLLPNIGNALARQDRYLNFAAQYTIQSQWALTAMYKNDNAFDVNSFGGHGTESTYMFELARGVTRDLFVYGFYALTNLTGAEITDPNSPNGTFNGASTRAYVGVGLNYRFDIRKKE
jgi:predicted porin